MKNIAITGATSMLGSSLARRAVERGIETLCIVRKDSTRLDNLPKSEKLKIIFANQSEYHNLDISGLAIPGDYDVFYHFAWTKTFGADRDDADTQTLNIQYALDAARLAKRIGCGKFVGAGSQAEYGIVSEPLKPQTPANPENGYGVAKYAAGKLARILCAQLGMEFNWVRIVSTFGPLDAPYMLIMYTINELRAGRPPEFTGCEQIWDYLYCDDAADAFLAVGEKGADGKTYPLGSGERRQLSDYLESVKNIIAPDMALRFGVKEYYPNQPMYLCADISELTGDTGWKPAISFEEGIKRILQGEIE
ncbi:MAG: NAD(P)-dependent oxidoreductase [Chitinispirillales bacterium]|jgi:nucleoside-diphosphate-sugar epimerase|nr:NAD(P)-dependent oxidoreductase [Chitinispirillales bacterium]